jgi:F-type H+-transporting ATPase subunit delta
MADQAISTGPSHVLDDPSATAVARTYATAFLNAAAAAGEQQPLEELTSFYDDVLKPNPQFAALLSSELLSEEHKLALLERTVRGVASPFFSNFLKVVAEHGRLGLMPVILAEAWLEHERRANQKRVYVKSAVPLDQNQLDQIKNRLQSLLSSEPILIPSVDEKLIGGLVVQVGDTVYDGSLRTRLKKLRQRLREGYLNEIQSGRNRFSYPEGN